MNHGKIIKRGKRKVKGVPHSNATCLPLHQEKAEIDKNQTRANQTNVRKSLRLALSFLSDVITMLKGLKKRKNKITQGNASNKSPRRINHKATKSKTNTGTTALDRSEDLTTWWGRVKALLQPTNFTLDRDATLNHN